MRILSIGDPHLRHELPYSAAFQDGRRSEWEGVKRVIHDTATTCDAIVLLGDTFNLRHNHSSVIRQLIEFLQAFGDKEIHILVGNHERYSSNTALDFLDKVAHPRWFIYTQPTLTKVAGVDAFMIPYMTPGLLGTETKEDAVKKLVAMFPSDKIPLSFAHHGITGATSHGTSMDLFNEIILPQDEMEKHFGHSFAGHIHSKQIISPAVIMTGNIFSNEVGDHGKVVWVYDNLLNENGFYVGDGGISRGTIGGWSVVPPPVVEQVDLPIRGIYKVEVGDTDSWLFDINEIPANSIVKCVVSSRGVVVDEVREALKRFDASIIIEQYPNERPKTHFEDAALDLSVDNLLKVYAQERNVDYAELQQGFELIKS